MEDLAVRTERLTKIYSRRHIALNGVTLNVPRGSSLGILGQNGAGKTTLVKLLLGLQVPSAGKVWILGQRMGPNAATLRRRIGYLPAEPKFPPGMTPIDYLDYIGQLTGLVRRVRRPRLAAMLRAVDLNRSSGEKIAHFSTGMRTRLAVAASLLGDPDLLIWDEPSHGLDPEARRSMLDLMLQLAQSKTLLLCSHQLTDIQAVCQQTIVLHEGQMIFNGALGDLQQSLRPSDIEITLIGDKKGVADAMQTIQAIDEIASAKVNKNVLSLTIKTGASHATGLANVLVTLADHGIEMTNLHVSGGQTERAIAGLLREEGRRGLTRAYEPLAG